MTGIKILLRGLDEKTNGQDDQNWIVSSGVLVLCRLTMR